MEEYIYREFIENSDYRDFIEKNFEDKIFFFEPINKFYDLLWIKLHAFEVIRNYHIDFPIKTYDASVVEEFIINYIQDSNILK
jgi:hypothetical protein